MINVCTIGIGNCGGQIADLAMQKYNIKGMAINSSANDLVNIKHIAKVIVGDSSGAGKSREEARNFVKLHIKKLLEQEKFIEHVESNDVIFVISSTGGGTGSGMAPIMVDILSRKFQNKKFILVEVYPPIAESVAAQQNSLDYLNEVNKFLPNAVYMAYDNNKRSNLSSPEMMKSINEEIVDAISVLRGDYLYPTPYNSIDEKDMLRFFETPGRLALYILPDIKEKDFDDHTIEDAILDVIKNVSTNVELDRDKIVKRLGIITNLNEKMNKLFNDNIPKIKEFVGEPVEGYQHCYIAGDDEPQRAILIVSGLSVPDDRLQKIVQRIEESVNELSKVKESSILGSITTDKIKDLRMSDNNTSDLDLDDLFSKYDD